MQTVMTAMAGPNGPSLVEQARLVASARVQEFQPVGRQAVPATERPAQFEMWRVVAAMAGRDPVRQVQAVLALQEFMHAPGHLSQRTRGRLHEMITVGDMNTVNNSARDYIDRFLITEKESDDGWRQLFTMHDEAVAAAQANKSGFRVLDLESGITFKERKPGEAIEFRGLKGTENWVLYKSFGGGAAIDRQFWDDQDYLTIGDVLLAFREAAYGEQSDNMYGLLTALATDYNFSTGADLIAKINGACADILRGVGRQRREAEYQCDVPGRARAGEESRGRGGAGDDVRCGNAGDNEQNQTGLQPQAGVHVAGAQDRAAGAGIYVGLSGGRSKAGIRQDLTMFGQFNIARYADDLAGFLRYAGVVEAAQWRRIP